MFLFFSLQGCFLDVENPPVLAQPICISTQSSCFVETPVGRFHIDFDQESPRAETPFNLFVRYQGDGNISAVEGHMEGVDMFMGKIPLIFDAKDGQDSTFYARTMFGSCSLKEMRWRIILNANIEYNGSITNQSFFIEFVSRQVR